MANLKKNITDITQECLEKLEKNGGSIDEILQDYQDQEDKLRPILETALWLQENQAQLNPRHVFITSSRKRLVARIHQENPKQQTTSEWTVWESFRGFFPKKGAIQIAVVLLLVVAMIVGSSGVAFAARDSLPGDVLYPVKTGHEKLLLAFSLSEIRDIELYAAFTQRRLEEIEEVVEKGRLEDLPIVISIYEAQMSNATQLLQSAVEKGDPEVIQMSDELYGAWSRHSNILEHLLEITPPGQRQGIERALDVSKNSLKKLSEIQKRRLSDPDSLDLETEEAQATQTPPGRTTKDHTPGPPDKTSPASPGNPTDIDGRRGPRATLENVPPGLAKTPGPAQPERPTPRPERELGEPKETKTPKER